MGIALCYTVSYWAAMLGLLRLAYRTGVEPVRPVATGLLLDLFQSIRDRSDIDIANSQW